MLEELIAIVYFRLGYLSNKKFRNDISPSKSPLFAYGSSSRYPITFQYSYLSDSAKYSKSLECPPAPNNN